MAGVIGRTRFSWDLWGDVVNTASRMASVGVGDRIQVTGDVVRGLGERYVFTPRGPIHVKGKGAVETWFLEGRRETDEAGFEYGAAVEPSACPVVA